MIYSENFQLSPSLSINLTKMKNKDYYWLFVKKSTPLVTTLSKWERELSSNDILWKNYFKQIKFMCKENKLKEFYFKLVHKIPVFKKILIKYWHLIAGNHNLAQILKHLPIVAYREDKSLKIMSEQEFLHFNLITKELYTVGVK